MRKTTPVCLSGVVEEIGNKGFTNLDELGEILNAAVGKHGPKGDAM